MSDQQTQTGPFLRPPIRQPMLIQFAAVMPDGSIVYYELPTEPQDEASLHIEKDHGGDAWDPTQRGSTRTQTVRITAEVTYRGLDRPGGLFRSGGAGGAEPTGEIPGRQVPDYIVAQIAQMLSRWSPDWPQLQRWGTPAYAAAVRAQATMTGQRIWDEAYMAGVHAGVDMSRAPTRMILPADTKLGVAPMRMPLFGPHGRPNWTPGVCPWVPEYDDGARGGPGQCGEEVETIETFPAALQDEQGNRQVTVRPCGHTIWAPDPVEVTFS